MTDTREPIRPDPHDENETPRTPDMQNNHDQLEARLAKLTAPEAEDAGLWRKALEKSKAGRKRPMLPQRWRIRRMHAIAGTLALVVLASVVVVGLDVGGAREGRYAARAPDPMTTKESSNIGTVDESLRLAGIAPRRTQSSRSSMLELPDYAKAPGFDLDSVLRSSSGGGTTSPFQDAATAERLVAHKSDLQLETKDVAATFARVGHLLSIANGEYVESSSLAGEGEHAHGQLVVRVASARLDTFLNELRGIAKVTRETTTGDDVTDQVVDLEARLSNAQRIEKELLELIESREKATLEDIMAVRSRLDSVRLEIERYQARRTHLASQVKLARVLVVIRAAPVEPEPEPAATGPTLGDRLSLAAERGWNHLAESLAWALQVAISGAVVWLVLLILTPFVIRAWRKSLSFK